MSLKVIEIGAIRKLDAVSNSPSIVTMTISVAVCEIFSVNGKNGVTLKTSSRSLKIAPFDRPYTYFLFVHHCKYSSILYRF